ncbi:MAG: porin [Gammaproteobacteria bacterium]|nr:porin [Gammaproteobacteria bacterium]
MNKNLISFAVAAVLAGGMTAVQANSNVTVYGKVMVSIDSSDDSAGNSDTNLNSRNGFGAIGVKGSEDLGNGLTAMFQLEYGTNPAAGGEFGGRDQWLGLKGDFGMVRAGTVTTNYKQSGAKLDPLWRTSLDIRETGGLSSLHGGKGEQGQGRATNTMRYDSPSFNGAKIVANYTLDSGLDEEDGYGIGLHYDQGPLFASFDYINNGVDGEDDAWKLGAKYSMDAIAVFGHYERGGLVDSLTGMGESGANLWHLGGSFSMGSTMFVATFAQGDDDAGTEYDSWRLAVKHDMSKRTSVFGGFARVDVDGATDEDDLFTVGMVHNF